MVEGKIKLPLDIFPGVIILVHKPAQAYHVNPIAWRCAYGLPRLTLPAKRTDAPMKAPVSEERPALLYYPCRRVQPGAWVQIQAAAGAAFCCNILVLDIVRAIVYTKGMRRIHAKPSPRLEIGAPFADLLDELLKSTNTDNLSPNWNRTDMARYAIAELWKRTGKPLPKAAEILLPHFWKDLEV